MKMNKFILKAFNEQYKPYKFFFIGKHYYYCENPDKSVAFFFMWDYQVREIFIDDKFTDTFQFLTWHGIKGLWDELKKENNPRWDFVKEELEKMDNDLNLPFGD